MAAALACAASGLGGKAFAKGAEMDKKDVRILVMGDSLSAEYGISKGQGWVALMEQRIRQRGLGAQVFNSSISGETTAGGRSRLAKELERTKPTLLVIELGCNDALHGMPLEVPRSNLAQMVAMGQRAGAKVVLVGMRMPPNYGKAYADGFDGIYKELAAKTNSTLAPFMFAGVADVADARDYFQADGLHPLAKAHPKILENIWPKVSEAAGWGA